MAEAAPATVESSNPPAAPPAAALAPPQVAPEPAKAAAQATPEPAPPVTEPAKAEPFKEAPLFTLPEDFKPPEAMVAKFTEFAKALPDPKLAQPIADLYIGMAREANAAWQKQIETLDQSNAEACKARFSAEELSAAETAVGWFSSFEPAFRELARRQLNDPVFTNAMRLIGELLSEDEIGSPSPPPPPVTDKRPLKDRAAEVLYGSGRKQ